MKVFISQKSLGFSNLCRQRVILAGLVFFFPEFAICPFPCGCLVESLVFHGPRCLVFVQLYPDHPGSLPFWNKVYRIWRYDCQGFLTCFEIIQYLIYKLYNWINIHKTACVKELWYICYIHSQVVPFFTRPWLLSFERKISRTYSCHVPKSFLSYFREIKSNHVIICS